MSLFRRHPPKGFVPGVVDVRAVGMQCDVCGTPVDTLRSQRDDTETGTNVLAEPCGHSIVPDYR